MRNGALSADAMFYVLEMTTGNRGERQDAGRQIKSGAPTRIVRLRTSAEPTSPSEKPNGRLAGSSARDGGAAARDFHRRPLNVQRRPYALTAAAARDADDFAPALSVAFFEFNVQ